jgi:hypothetical protein
VMVVCYFSLITILASVIGDRVGYNYGQRGLARRWESFARERDAEPA